MAKRRAKGEPLLPASLTGHMERHPLRLAQGLFLKCDRLGYPDEGLRLTVYDDTPYNFHVELQLSRADATYLIAVLQHELARSGSENLPE
jgi:hypothetical protein